jgi:molybdate transport system permease protein
VGNIPGETRTLPLAIYSATQVPGGEEPAARLVLLSLGLALGALLASDYLAKKTEKRLGR